MFCVRLLIRSSHTGSRPFFLLRLQQLRGSVMKSDLVFQRIISKNTLRYGEIINGGSTCKYLTLTQGQIVTADRQSVSGSRVGGRVKPWSVVSNLYFLIIVVLCFVVLCRLLELYIDYVICFCSVVY